MLELPLRILVVDDLPTERLYIGSMLRLKGHVVVECCDGQEAVELYNPEFDLVMMDIMMNGMRGDVATTLIKEKFPKAWVVAVTTVKDDISLPWTLFDGYIHKPMTLEKMEYQIAKYRDEKYRRSTGEHYL